MGLPRKALLSHLPQPISGLLLDYFRADESPTGRPHGALIRKRRKRSVIQHSTNAELAVCGRAFVRYCSA